MIAIKSIQTTDQTQEGVNDGTARVQVVSDTFMEEITLYLGAVAISSSSAGSFGGLAPGDYRVFARNALGETAEEYFTIVAATADTTTLKYIIETDDFVIRIRDVKHQYSVGAYPKQLTLAGPVSHVTAFQSEDKAEPFSPSRLEFVIDDDGVFDTDEFALAEETDFFVEYVRGDQSFKGWLLPDQVEDTYADSGDGVFSYKSVALYASDGLLSLKSANFGNGTGADMFGIKSWYMLVRSCLDKLGYTYGNIIIVKSLQFDNAMDWFQVGCWADLFYDENGTPDNAYEALSKLLKGFKFNLFQHNGQFILCDNNVISRRVRGYDGAKYNAAFYEYDELGNLVNEGADVLQPAYYKVGVNADLVPVQQEPQISYDKSFKQLQADVKFNLLALLFNNPSFEIDAVAGQLPFGIKQNSSSGGVPGAKLVQNGYIGNWSFQVPGTGTKNSPTDVNQTDTKGFAEFSQDIDIDQSGKIIQLSFNWQPDKYTPIPELGLVFSVDVVFRRNDGKEYYLQQAPYRALLLQESGARDYNQSDAAVWQEIGGEYHSEGAWVSLKGTPTNDFIGWQSFSIDSPPLPAGTGKLFVHFRGSKLVPYDESATFAANLVGKAYFAIAPNDLYTVRYDNFIVTQGDPEETYNKQIGETHTVTNNTNYGKSEKKTVDIDLFNYPANRRVAGNIFYGKSYATADAGGKWTDPFVFFPPTLLPAVVIQQLARSYQRPMYKIGFTVEADYVPFFSVFEVEGYEGRPFVPYSIEHNPTKNEVTMTLVETDDTDMDGSYEYLAKFEKSAKKVVN